MVFHLLFPSTIIPANSAGVFLPIPPCFLEKLSDNGTQYTSKEFRKSIEILGIKQEYIWHHTPEQNGHVESFHKTLKKEYIWPQEFTNFQMAEIALAGAFQDYNNQRIHSSVGYMPPNEFIKQWEMTHK